MSTLEDDFYAAVMIKLEHLEGGKKEIFLTSLFLSTKHQKMAEIHKIVLRFVFLVSLQFLPYDAVGSLNSTISVFFLKGSFISALY